MIKVLERVRLEEIYLNIMKYVYDKHIANVSLMGKKLKANPLKTGTREGFCCPHYFSTQHLKH